MARKRANYRLRKKTIYQDSPFLNLPPEIRTLIYRQALFKPTPIDLWPHSFTTYNRNDQDLDPALRNRLFKNLHPESVTVRDQKDLQYVRKEMATGLLSTCTQIFHEAQHIFWTENRFHFSGDSQWYGARRFLASIGPRAISQLRTVELFAPVTPECMLGTQRITDWSIDYKNHPKMHMVKSLYDGGDNARYVVEMLKTASLSIGIRFILQNGFGIRSGNIGISSLARDRIIGFKFMEPVEVAIPDFAKRIELVLEDGASMQNLTDLTHVTDKGVDLVCLPGSSIDTVNVGGENVKVVVTEETRWIDPNIELDKYVGVSQLYDQPVTPTVANHGGRVRNTPAKKHQERRLQAFGGSRFAYVRGYDCQNCNRTTVYVFVSTGYCGRCGTYVFWDKCRDVLVLAKMKRALRRDPLEWNVNAYEGLTIPTPTAVP